MLEVRAPPTAARVPAEPPPTVIEPPVVATKPAITTPPVAPPFTRPARTMSWVLPLSAMPAPDAITTSRSASSLRLSGLVE